MRNQIQVKPRTTVWIAAFICFTAWVATAEESNFDQKLFEAVDTFSSSKGEITGLVEKGADPNAKANQGITPLMLAALRGNKSAITELLAAGARLEDTAVGGSTALMLAARDDKKNAVGLLLDAGAKADAQNDDGWTPLMYAARNKAWQTIKLFVERGLSLEKETPDGWTAVLIAVNQGHGSVVDQLIKAGAPLPPMSPEGIPTLVRAANAGDGDIVLRVLQYHPNLEIRDPGGKTALVAAAAAGNTEALMELLRKGASTEAKDAEGKTALDHAEGRSDTEMAALLGAPWEPWQPSNEAATLSITCEKLGGEVRLSIEAKGDRLELGVYFPKPVSAYLGGAEPCALDPAKRTECGFKRFSAGTSFYFDVDNKRKTGQAAEYGEPEVAKGAEFEISLGEVRTSVQSEGGGVVSRQVMLAQIASWDDSLSYEDTEGNFQSAERDLNRITLSGALSLLGIEPGQKVRIGAEINLCGAEERTVTF